MSLAILLLWGVGCTQDSRLLGTATPPDIGSAVPATDGAGHFTRPSRQTRSFANLPDRGSLVAYPKQREVRQDGAYTWHRTGLSEEHALQAVGGVMKVTTPLGEQLQFQYERHVEHASGDWTWIGRGKNGAASDEIVVTFGERAAFGTISQPGRAPLKLTMNRGTSWLVETNRSMIAGIDNPATRPRGPDFLIPPKIKSSLGASAFAAPTATPTALASTTSASAQTAAATTVDVLLGYTSGFAAAQGGASQAVTRLNNMVEITNQAYTNSQVDARIRLVHAMQVSYPDNTSNERALEALTGFRAPSTPTTPDPAFAALRAARNQYGADLVSLVRQFNTPENDGCGIAWLIGGGQTGIDSSDEYFGYSVVSDGRDAGTDGKTYFCREETLAHELGHNMGSQHDRAAATVNGVLKYGLYSYSFGYKTGVGEGNFYTVMAYGDSGQTNYRAFSNPRVTFCSPQGGPLYACGIENVADNARSLGQAMPLVAMFRAPVVPEPTIRVPALYAISKMGVSGSGRTEVHALDGSTTYQSFLAQIATALGLTGGDNTWQFALNDMNSDDVPDLYSIFRQGSSGRTEVHVLDGARHFQVPLLQTATILQATGSGQAWDFLLGDYNRDGTADLYVIYKLGGSGRTEVHVLNGADGFQSILAQIATAVGQTGSDSTWQFELADMNRDGVLDLYCIFREGLSNRTEVHVLDGARNFQTALFQAATALQRTGSGNDWDFKVGDYNRDGTVDLYVIYKRGASGRTEVHVLDGASEFGQFSAHIATGLDATGSDSAWEFELSPP